MGVDIYPEFENESNKENCFRELQESNILRNNGNMRAIINEGWLSVLDFFVDEHELFVGGLDSVSYLPYMCQIIGPINNKIVKVWAGMANEKISSLVPDKDNNCSVISKTRAFEAPLSDFETIAKYLTICARNNASLEFC